MYKTLVYLLIVLSLTSSCGFRPMVGAPWMQKMIKQGPDGPDNFRQGWVDGCETGISGTANRLQRSFYKFKQNYELSQDPVYYAGWKTAYNYCQRLIYQYSRRNLL